MKNSKLLFLLPFIGLLAFRSDSDPLPIGSSIPKPGIMMKDISGKDVSLASVKTDAGLLVMFSCNTCPYVIRNQERTRAICNYARQQGIGVILLNSNEGSRNRGDSYQDMQEYGRAQQYQWPYAVDKNNVLADAFGADRTPECFLFNAGGKLVYRGAIDDNPSNANGVTRQHLRMAIDEMLHGKEVEVKSSRSVGCTIKRI